MCGMYVSANFVFLQIHSGIFLRKKPNNIYITKSNLYYKRTSENSTTKRNETDRSRISHSARVFAFLFCIRPKPFDPAHFFSPNFILFRPYFFRPKLDFSNLFPARNKRDDLRATIDELLNRANLTNLQRRRSEEPPEKLSILIVRLVYEDL